MTFERALAVIEAVMREGARTHAGDWRTLPAAFHIAHATRHLELLAAADRSEPHLAHAATRLLMALELAREPDGPISAAPTAR